MGVGAVGRAEAMAAFIAARCVERMTTADIARHVGLHKNYAMTVFRRAFGSTLVAHLTQHRLSHAQRLLVTTRDRIVDIAFASGFGSLSRFNEAFRAALGCTPREYRRQNESADGEIGPDRRGRHQKSTSSCWPRTASTSFISPRLIGSTAKCRWPRWPRGGTSCAKNRWR